MTAAEPKYMRIANELRRALQNGQYAPGGRLPGENSLMEIYGVSRMTVRQAVGVLQAMGLVDARKGAGVFVRPLRPLRRRGVRRLSRSRWAQGRSISSADTDERALVLDRLTVTEEEPDTRALAGLRLDAGDMVWVRRRRFLLEGKPVLLANSSLPAELVAGSAITQEDTGPGGIYARLGDLGYEPVRFREEVWCRMPSPEEASALHLMAATPVVEIFRVAFAADELPVEVNDMVLDSAAYVLEYEFDA
jgi:GntR family transcriptional regulator